MFTVESTTGSNWHRTLPRWLCLVIYMHVMQHNISPLTILLQVGRRHFKCCTCCWLSRGFVMAIHTKVSEYKLYNHVHSSNILGAINKNSHTHTCTTYIHTYVHTYTRNYHAQATIGDSPCRLSASRGWVRGRAGRQSCLLSLMPTDVCN